MTTQPRTVDSTITHRAPSGKQLLLLDSAMFLLSLIACVPEDGLGTWARNRRNHSTLDKINKLQIIWAYIYTSFFLG